MATENQINFVKDVEGAVSAMLQQNKQPVGVTLGEVIEMAGHGLNDFAGVVGRLAAKNEIQLLKRMQAAFDRLNVKPRKLTATIEKLESDGVLSNDAVSEAEPLKLEPVLPPEPKATVQAFQKTVPAASNATDDIAVVTQVLRILNPLTKFQQGRVINSVSAFLGVGE